MIDSSKEAGKVWTIKGLGADGLTDVIKEFFGTLFHYVHLSRSCILGALGI